jgi:hypothetical protein
MPADLFAVFAGPGSVLPDFRQLTAEAPPNPQNVVGPRFDTVLP